MTPARAFCLALCFGAAGCGETVSLGSGANDAGADVSSDLFVGGTPGAVLDAVKGPGDASEPRDAGGEASGADGPSIGTADAVSADTGDGPGGAG
jgi:hypothetical protein